MNKLTTVPAYDDAPKIEDAPLDDMITTAAAHWDGADEHEWALGKAVLAEQVNVIYDFQHKPWHEGMFEPEVIKHWIAMSIRSKALTLREYVRQLTEAHPCTCETHGIGRPAWDNQCPIHGDKNVR